MGRRIGIARAGEVHAGFGMSCFCQRLIETALIG